MTNAELLERAQQRDAHLEQLALESEREGDTQNCHFAMAVRAANARLIAKLKENDPNL